MAEAGKNGRKKAAKPRPRPGPAPMPPCLDGLDIVSLDWRGGVALGAIRDRHRHTLTAVVPVSGPQFVVEPRGEQERLLAGWGDLLGQYAVERGVVAHLSWSDLAQPSGMADHIAWLNSESRGVPNEPAATSYRDLLEVGTASAINHEAVVTITVARERLSRRRTGMGGVDEQLRRALVTSVESSTAIIDFADMTYLAACMPALRFAAVAAALAIRSIEASRCFSRGVTNSSASPEAAHRFTTVSVSRDRCGDQLRGCTSRRRPRRRTSTRSRSSSWSGL